MADELFGTSNAGPKEPPHRPGQFLAYCVDVVDLGEAVEQFGDQPKRLTRKGLFIFITWDRNTNDFMRRADGKPYFTSMEFTVSSDKKSKARKFCRGWRGEDFPSDPKYAIPFHEFSGKDCMLTIENPIAKGSGNPYTLVSTASPLPDFPGIGPIPRLEYARPEWVVNRKKDYAEAASKFRAEQSTLRPAAPAPATIVPAPAPVDPVQKAIAAELAEQDTLPFSVTGINTDFPSA